LPETGSSKELSACVCGACACTGTCSNCYKNIVEEAAADVHEHASKNRKREHPKEPINRAAASNTDHRLPLPALEQRDDYDECPQAKQEEQAGPRHFAFSLKNCRQLARNLLRVLLVVVKDRPRLPGVLRGAKVCVRRKITGKREAGRLPRQLSPPADALRCLS
jgi:hypothetical protein